MSVFGVSDTKYSQAQSAIFTPKAAERDNSFGGLVNNKTESAPETGTTSSGAASAGQSYRAWGIGAVNATYNSSGQINGGQVDLTAEVRAASENGFQVTDELMGKLTGTDEGDFIEGLCEITGKTPAQVMTALLNMNAQEAAGFAQSLAELTGADASAFTPMLSKLTGHDETMIQQCLNGEDDDEEEGQKSGEQGDFAEAAKSAQTLDYQRGYFQTMNFPSVNVIV